MAAIKSSVADYCAVWPAAFAGHWCLIGIIEVVERDFSPSCR